MQTNSFSKVCHALNMAVSVLKSFKVPDKVPDADADKFAAFISGLESALKTPRRNCDVGTAMEQGERFSAYCRAHKHPKSECLPCPLFGQTGGYCELAWSQMPYEEGDEK